MGVGAHIGLSFLYMALRQGGYLTYGIALPIAGHGSTRLVRQSGIFFREWVAGPFSHFEIWPNPVRVSPGTVFSSCWLLGSWEVCFG
jgi:hypothetical protein